jgi:tRNA(adenine34) deaminase
MKAALKEAAKAKDKNEVPIGCVIVYQNKIIARGHNEREEKQTTLSHAEVIAINKACKKIGSWRLEDCNLYVTLEPCPMCSGAILQARMHGVYFGAYDPKAGACGSVFNLFDYKFNHSVEVIGGIMEEECRGIIQDFFQSLRAQKN